MLVLWLGLVYKDQSNLLHYPQILRQNEMKRVEDHKLSAIITIIETVFQEGNRRIPQTLLESNGTGGLVLHPE